MSTFIEYLSVFLIVLNLIMLSSSRLGVCIRAVTAQGIILGVLPLVEEWGNLHTSTVVVAIITLILKGGVFPYLLTNAAERAGVKRELEPMISYILSLIIGVAMLIFSFWLQSRLPVRSESSTDLLLPAAFFSIMTGFFMTIARRKALTQVLGYLALENGIYAFGASMLSGHPWLFELGILLDVFVAVFVMGIAIFHISREFSHMDADRLASLRDISEEGAL